MRWALAVIAAFGCGGSGDSEPPPPVDVSCTSAADCDGVPCVFPTDGGEGACALACPEPNEDAICGPACTLSGTFVCPAGWSCLALGAGASCICEPQAETCNASDDDCDGIVDTPAATDPLCVVERGTGFGCSDGACVPCAARCDDACVDPTLDNANCTACGAACTAEAGSAQAACSSSGCRQVGKVVDDPNVPLQLAVQGTHLVWANNTGREVRHCTLPACSDSAAIRVGQDVTGIATDGTTVFWLVVGNALNACPVTGCGAGPTTMAAGVDPRELVLAGGRLHWRALDGELTDAIFRCDPADCQNTRGVLAGGRRGLANLVAIGGDMYWTERDLTTGAMTVRTCPLTSCVGGPVEVVPAQPEMLGLGVRGDRVYWPRRGALAGELELWSCERTGCTTPRRDATKRGTFTMLANVAGGFVVGLRDFDPVEGALPSGALVGCVATDCSGGLEGIAGSLATAPQAASRDALFWAAWQDLGDPAAAIFTLP